MTFRDLLLHAERLTHEADAVLALGRLAYRGGDVQGFIDSLQPETPPTPFLAALSAWSAEHYSEEPPKDVIREMSTFMADMIAWANEDPFAKK